MLQLSCRVALAAASLCGLVSVAGATERPHHRYPHLAAAGAGHPLTIGGRRRGIYRVGNTIVAPGGFSAHGYGYPPATPEEREEARNAAIRDGSTALYNDGFDGFGVDDGGPGFGYDNPYYGNAFSSYTGYNGVPTQLAFGPAFAERYITGHEDRERAGPPSPAALGYQAVEPDDDE